MRNVVKMFILVMIMVMGFAMSSVISFADEASCTVTGSKSASVINIRDNVYRVTVTVSVEGNNVTEGEADAEPGEETESMQDTVAGCSNVVVTDTTSKWVNLDTSSVTVYDGSGNTVAANVSVSETGSGAYQIIWNVKEGVMTPGESYRMEYNVTVDTEEEGFQYNTEYPAGDGTSITYIDMYGASAGTSTGTPYVTYERGELPDDFVTPDDYDTTEKPDDLDQEEEELTEEDEYYEEETVTEDVTEEENVEEETSDVVESDHSPATGDNTDTATGNMFLLAVMALYVMFAVRKTE